MRPYTNERELRVIGMSRSGNHAVINWIMSQARGRICFLNAVQALNNPFLSARPLHHPDDEPAIVNYPGFNLRREQAGRLSQKDLLIYSHEDEFLGRIGNDIFERYHDGFLGPSRSRLDVLILRDPFNLMASRMRAGFCRITPKTTVRMWKQHAREFLRQTQHLRHGPILISYNDWATHRGYRRGIAHALGLRFTDAEINTVASCAGGSSFDGTRLDGKALRMRVLQRWRAYAHDPDFAALFDQEVFNLAEQIFGRLPGIETLLSGSIMHRAG